MHPAHAAHTAHHEQRWQVGGGKREEVEGGGQCHSVGDDDDGLNMIDKRRGETANVTDSVKGASGGGGGEG